MNTEYVRVIPRDLFNEAKLLKCIGKLVLNIHDGKTINNMSFDHDGEPFRIGLLDEGALEVENIYFFINDTRVSFKSQYNAKSNFPLFADYDYCEYLVFDEEGNYTDEFTEFANQF